MVLSKSALFTHLSVVKNCFYILYDANLGYLYENAAAQMITASGNGLFYHTWKKTDNTHDYEIDFLLASNAKLVPMEIK